MKSRRASHVPPRRSGSVVAALWALLLPGTFGLAPRAVAYPMPAEFYRLSEEFVSPHVPWAKPLAGGPVRALVIAPRGAQRETIELAERLDLQYDYVLALSPTELGWTAASGPYAPADGISDAEVVAELRRKLAADYDVIIVGHLDWKAFPTELLYELLKKVHDGTGLVYTHAAFGRVKWLDEVLARAQPVPGDVATVARGVPCRGLPVLADLGVDKVLELKQFKQGRIATLDYGKARPAFQYLTPKVPDDDPAYGDAHYEYYLSLVIRSVLWAARREPPVRIRGWGEDGATVARAALGDTFLAATLAGRTGPAPLTAEMNVRRTDGTVVLTRRETLTLAQPEVSLTFRLAPLPRGRYFADLVLREAGRSLDWAGTFFDVDTAVHIAGVEVENAVLEPGQTVAATVRLSEALPKGWTTDTVLEDTLGRVLGTAAARLSADRTAATCEFALTSPLTTVVRVRATLRDRDQVIDEATGSASVIRRQWDDFRFCVWSPGAHFNEPVRRLMFRQLTRAGVDTFTNSGTSENAARRVAELGFGVIPYMTRYSYDGKESVRKPCLTDPAFLEGELAKLRKHATAQWPYDPQGYTLGDECFLARGDVDVCFSPTCIADFREWLATEYASVAELNQSWGTRYASFAEAEPIRLAEAKTSGQLPRWVDHRRHMEFVYARMMERARTAIRGVDPTARVGFDGPFDTNPQSGNDWWRLMQVFDLCNVYFHEPDEWEAVRSFAKPGALLGLWYGPYETTMRTEDYNRFFPWRALFTGYNSVWWYAVYHGLSVCPMDALTPSMTWYPYLAATVEELREIKSGTGKALMHAQRQCDGVAVHYSQSSVHAAAAYPGAGQLVHVWRQWYSLIEDAGLQYNCLAYGQIEKDGIAAGTYRALVLPFSQAVSPREADAIKAFVHAGGVVLADLRPAVADQHGRLCTPGLLDELFGVTRQEGKLDLAAGVDGAFTTAFGRVPAGTSLVGLTVDPNLVPTTAKAHAAAAGTPLVLVNDVGRGHAVLLNFSLARYASNRSQPEASVYWALLLESLALGGVVPRAQVSGPAGPLYQLEVASFRDGPVEYVGFLKYRVSAAEPAVTARVTFGDAAFTYDVRAGMPLGNVDQFETPFQPDRARLYCRLPYSVRRIAVEAAAARCKRGDPVPLELSLETAGKAVPGRHWFHLDVAGPDGAPLLHYAQNVPVVDGKGSALIPLAFNDPVGRWQVRARDVATGLTAETQFRVR